jgi:hypothetical protein
MSTGGYTQERPENNHGSKQRSKQATLETNNKNRPEHPTEEKKSKANQIILKGLENWWGA